MAQTAVSADVQVSGSRRRTSWGRRSSVGSSSIPLSRSSRCDRRKLNSPRHNEAPLPPGGASSFASSPPATALGRAGCDASPLAARSYRGPDGLVARRTLGATVRLVAAGVVGDARAGALGAVGRAGLDGAVETVARPIRLLGAIALLLRAAAV